MIWFEMKKIFLKRVNQVVLLVLLAIVLVGSFLTIRDVKCYREDGTMISGLSAARQLRKEKNKWQGRLTEEVIQQAVAENQAVNASAESEELMLAGRQNLEDIRELVNMGFSKIGEYDYYVCDQIAVDQAESLYEKRLSNLKEEIIGTEQQEKLAFSQKEKEFLIHQYKNLKTPLFYEYMEGWKALLDSQYLPTLMIITIVIIGFLISGIFSDEFQLKADSIFFSTKLGRNRAVGAKIKAGFLAITAVYWSVMLLFSVIVLGVLGFGGAGCMIQTGGNWYSMYNITYFQDWLLSMCGGYVANLFILMLAMLISAKTRSTVVAITIPFALSCAPMFLGRVSMLTELMNLFPDMLLRISKFLDVFLVCEIGGKVFGLYFVLIPVYLLLSLMLTPVLYYGYRKSEVK